MKTRFLIMIVIIMFGIVVIPVNAQYKGDKAPKGEVLEECIGGPGMCPEQQLAERLENDQKNALFVIAIGIPSLAVLVFLIWRKRK